MAPAFAHRTEPSAPPVVVVGHGSRAPNSRSEFAGCFKQLADKLSGRKLSCAYIELQQPSLDERLMELAEEHNTIDLVPIFLFDASHTQRDIPEAIAKATAINPKLKVRQTKALGNSQALAAANREALAKLLERNNVSAAAAQLLVVGRGATADSARQQFLQAANASAVGQHWRQISHAYLNLGDPRLNQALDQFHTAAEPIEHLVVLPFLIFQGRLVESLDAQLNELRDRAQRHGRLVHCCPHLAATGALGRALHEQLAAL